MATTALVAVAHSAAAQDITNPQNSTFIVYTTAGSANIINNGFLIFLSGGTGGNATITNNASGITYVRDTSSGGAARFIGNGGALDISELGTNGTSAGSIEGNGNVFLGAKNLLVGGNNISTTFSGVIQDYGAGGGTGGSLTKAGSGTLTLSGFGAYSGATTVDGGTLVVNSSIAASSGVTVNNGGTLTGSGPVSSTQVNGGGIFAPGWDGPGTSMTVAGNLALQSGALYVVQLSPPNATMANVSGLATLGGTVQVTFQPGSYGTRNYTILHAAGGLGGTTFGGVSSGLPGFNAALSYTATDVLLNLTASLGATAALRGHHKQIADTVNNLFNDGGTLPRGFLGLFALSGGSLVHGLSQVAGEATTGAQQGAFQLGGQFLGLMLDPFADGRGGTGGGGALGFAPEREALPDDIALAYARAIKAPAYKAPVVEPRWTAWGGVFGGYNRTNGDAATGSHDLTARAGGFAAGLDYRLTPDSVIGFGLAGGATSWTLADGLGGGKSDAFQAGIYGKTYSGPLYLAGGFAFANHWMSTDRIALGDQLTANFNAQSFGGRIESGYRFAMPIVAITPYAALQAQSFRTPFYSETDVTGGGLALSHNARSATDVRGELGSRFDKTTALASGALLTLRSRVGWAHDWASDPSSTAIFQTLPGQSFIVNGARPAKDTALVSAGAELRFANGVTLAAKFDGEFASRASTYTGAGTLRVAW